jgi:hypothetical protein
MVVDESYDCDYDADIELQETYERLNNLHNLNDDNYIKLAYN